MAALVFMVFILSLGNVAAAQGLPHNSLGLAADYPNRKPRLPMCKLHAQKGGTRGEQARARVRIAFTDRAGNPSR
jgi:hypothetical protein